MKKNRLDKDLRVRITFELERIIDDVARMNNLKPATLSRLILQNHVKDYIPKHFKTQLKC
jgi:hypothetical protein